MNNKVKFLRGTATEYEASTKDNDTFYYTTDTKKLYLGENEVGNGIDPKVIQAHIDNQTIHAKVWRGTQEEYNAIESKEDDTVYIIKDSDNTLADKLIDDTSTTATDKTWSTKKINENDEVARAAINTHSSNAEIHVTAEEKAAWNAVNYSNPNLLINPDFKINQRGSQIYRPHGGAASPDHTSSYTVDMWSLDLFKASASVETDGVRVTASYNVTSNTHVLWQWLEFPLPPGKYTLSVNVKEVTGLWSARIRTVTADGTFASSYYTPAFSTGVNKVSADLPENEYISAVSIGFNEGTKVGDCIKLEWGKLELGSVATPFMPPDPATELAKCQRYYQIRSTGDIAAVDLRPSMRTTPTVMQLADGNYAYSAEL